MMVPSEMRSIKIQWEGKALKYNYVVNILGAFIHFTC